MRFILLAVSMFGALACTANAQEQPVHKVRAVSISVTKKLEGDDAKLFYQHPGTRVELLIDLRGKHVLDVESAGNGLVLSDDLGTILSRQRPQLSLGYPPPPPIGAGSRPGIAENGQRCLVSIRAIGIPKAGSKSVRIKGNLDILCSAKKATAESMEVTLDKKLRANAGPFKLAWGKADGEDEPNLLVDWSGEKRIISIEVITADGKKKTLEDVSGFSTGSGEDRTERQSYPVAIPGKCKLRISTTALHDLYLGMQQGSSARVI